MWPKMLLELLPHLSRLVPLWDKFLSSKASSDKATQDALASMTAASESMRGDIGQVASSHASLYRQLQDQAAQNVQIAAQIALLEDELKVVRIAAERADASSRTLEAAVAGLALWVRVGFVAMAVLLAVILALDFLRHP